MHEIVGIGQGQKPKIIFDKPLFTLYSTQSTWSSHEEIEQIDSENLEFLRTACYGAVSVFAIFFGFYLLLFVFVISNGLTKNNVNAHHWARARVV